MKRKLVRRTAKKGSVVAKHYKPRKGLLMLIKSWMFVVMFALMLGVGAIVGTYLNAQMNANTPTVAGVSVEVR